MPKDPAFLFYPSDYIGGTMGMTFEEKGAYMDLLMMQFNRGHMTSRMIGQVVGQLWVNIQHKFTQDEQGLWYNVRLEEEQIKRQNFTKSRRNNISGANQHSKSKGHTIGHKTSRMENVNVNENINKDKELKSRAKKFQNEVLKYDYPKAMFIEFIEYWTEPNKSKTKMRFESEKTWDLNLRLKRWARTSDSFKPKQKDAGRPMTQAAVKAYYEEHGKYPNQ